MDLLKQDLPLCARFLEQCFKEDNCAYILEIILECTDQHSRFHASNVMKFILNKLKTVEKDYLYEEVKVTTSDEKGETVETSYYKALSSRFVALVISQLNTTVAKNWVRVENILDILHSYAVGEEPIIVPEGT